MQQEPTETIPETTTPGCTSDTTTRVCTSPTCQERLTEHRLIPPEQPSDPSDPGVSTWECCICNQRDTVTKDLPVPAADDQ